MKVAHRKVRSFDSLPPPFPLALRVLLRRLHLAPLDCPLLANIYLNPLDGEMAQAGVEMGRYADDFVVLCRSAEEARQALEKIQRFAQAQGLILHPQKTRITDASQRGGGFELPAVFFGRKMGGLSRCARLLGYHFERGRRWPRRKSEIKLRQAIWEKTRRHDGRSLQAICEEVSRTLRGWFEYFKHSGRGTFAPLDSYVRGRLRSILRKRVGRKGRGRGNDHSRWPNQYFEAQGLFSLKQAYRAVLQSS